jgi:hypothetical protein
MSMQHLRKSQEFTWNQQELFKQSHPVRVTDSPNGSEKERKGSGRKRKSIAKRF